MSILNSPGRGVCTLDRSDRPTSREMSVNGVIVKVWISKGLTGQSPLPNAAETFHESIGDQ
jgi:hypothetical protein